MDRVEPGDEVLIGRQAILARLIVAQPVRPGGNGHHGHVRAVGIARSGNRLASGVDEPGPGRTAGLEPDGDRPVRSRPAGEKRGRSQVVLGIQEINGHLDVGGQAVHREIPVSHRVAVIRRPEEPGDPGRLEDHAADDQGVSDGLAIRPDDPGQSTAVLGRSVMATSWLACRVSDPACGRRGA